jgi:hypothetical protein
MLSLTQTMTVNLGAASIRIQTDKTQGISAKDDSMESSELTLKSLCPSFAMVMFFASSRK